MTGASAAIWNYDETLKMKAPRWVRQSRKIQGPSVSEDSMEVPGQPLWGLNNWSWSSGTHSSMRSSWILLSRAESLPSYPLFTRIIIIASSRVFHGNDGGRWKDRGLRSQTLGSGDLSRESSFKFECAVEPPGRFVKMQAAAGPWPRSFWFSRSKGGACELAFLISFQEMLMRLAWEPHHPHGNHTTLILKSLFCH